MKTEWVLWDLRITENLYKIRIRPQKDKIIYADLDKIIPGFDE